MSVNAELEFSTSQGGRRVVRVPNPLATITTVALDAAADRIITSNPYDDTVGNLVELLRATRVTVSRVDLIGA